MQFLIWFPKTSQENTLNWNDALGYVWQALSRLLFVVSVSAFILPCFLGEYKTLRSVFDNYFMMVMAKLSYSGYLIHLIVIFAFIYGANSLSYICNVGFLGFAIYVLICTFVFAIFMLLLVEIPMANVETRFLFPRRPPPKKEAKKEDISKNVLSINDGGSESRNNTSSNQIIDVNLNSEKAEKRD